MTSPYHYIPSSSSSDQDFYTDSPQAPEQYPLNSKIIVAAIVVLFCAILFITSLHIFAKWIWRPRNRNPNTIHFYHQEQAPSAARSAGLSKASIAQLPTFTYRAPAISDAGAEENVGLLECAVCLSEFQENEKGRLLPSCKHSFHIECIDMWFYSHSTCPLCRTIVMPTITTSPLKPLPVTTHEQQLEREEEAPQAASIAIDTRPSAHDSNPLSTTAIPDSDDQLAHAVQIPTNVLFCGNSTQLLPSQFGSSQSSEKPSPSSSAKTTRCIPHITIEIPTRQDLELTSPGYPSMSSRKSRCTSPHDTGCTSRTPLKSPGLRESLKRMLNSHQASRERVFTISNQEGSMDSKRIQV